MKGKVVVVTGSSSGIGRACVEKIISSGGAAIGLDLQTSTVSGGAFSHYHLDVRDEASLVSTMAVIDERFPAIDGLVNCAGVFSCSKPFYQMTTEEWDRTVSTNLTGTFLVSKHVAKRMMSNGRGKIVNIGCIRSRVFRPNMADYAASKAGVAGLTSAMALDLAPYNIQVNSVAPGFTYTGMTDRAFDTGDVRMRSEALIPAGRIAGPEDIARVVTFLLSEGADYITGETVVVDGGYSVSK